MTTPRPTARAGRLAARCAATAVVLAATSGCAVAEMITSEKTRHFDTVADAPTDGDLAFQLPEDLLPDDATDITVRVRTDDPNLKAYDWASESGELPGNCRPSGPPQGVDPFYTSGGWPDEATEGAGNRCGAAQVTEVDGHHYAWIAA